MKGNVTAVLGKDLGSELGKKGTASDLTLYNFKLQDTILSFVEPSSYPDKVQSLVSSVNMADQALLRIDSLNAQLAESIVALDALGMVTGYVVFAGVKPEAVKPLFAGTVAAGYDVLEDQPMEVKERLASLELKAEGKAVVQVDHSFSVKGVGTVALGVVKRGVVRRHDTLTAYPWKGKVIVKNIQVHDVDVEEAGRGVRVGVAMKDIRPEEVERGTLLAAEGSVKCASSLEADLSLSKYSPRGLGVGDTFLVNSCLNYAPAKVSEGSVSAGGAGRVRLALEKEVPLLGDRVALLDPGLKMPRVFGHGIVR
jgi:selenocysteine-specific translation elongation factor